MTIIGVIGVVGFKAVIASVTVWVIDVDVVAAVEEAVEEAVVGAVVAITGITVVVVVEDDVGCFLVSPLT